MNNTTIPEGYKKVKRTIKKKLSDGNIILVQQEYIRKETNNMTVKRRKEIPSLITNEMLIYIQGNPDMSTRQLSARLGVNPWNVTRAREYLERQEQNKINQTVTE